jgi:hypothetical protein
VPLAVRVKPLLAEVGSFLASELKASGEDVPNTEAGERGTSVVEEHVSFRPQVQISLPTE